MRLSKKVQFSILPFSVMLLTWAGGVFADADSQAPDSLEEVLVVAQKRVENLQDVPISVSVVGGKSLQSLGIGNPQELVATVPGLTFTDNARQAAPHIRGVGSTTTGGGTENSVATYVDGVYYASSLGTLLSFNNIEQVEVLKGPQGTLFGRNATGGVILITTRDPSSTPEASARLSYGNHGTVGADAYISGGLNQWLDANLAVQYTNQRDGFGRNFFNGLDVNKSRDLSVRSKWKASLGDHTSAVLSADFENSFSYMPAFVPGPGDVLMGGYEFHGGYWDTDTNTQPYSHTKQYGASLRIDHELHAARLVSISAYRKTDWSAGFDSDAFPADLLSAQVISPEHQVSQEFQLISSGSGPSRWVLGAYYFEHYGGFVPLIVPAPGLGFTLHATTTQETKSYALFGQWDYDLTDRDSVTVGLRWTTDKVDFFGATSLALPALGITIPTGPATDSKRFSKPTWRLAFNHEFNDDVMGYVSYNRGFKSGGYDPANVPPIRVEPEVLDAYEIGVKSEWFGRKMRLNVSGFFYDYKNMQLNQYANGVSNVYNGKSATLYGLDVDLTVRPVENLKATLGIEALHSRFGDFPVSGTVKVAGGGIASIGQISADGKQLTQAPKFAANFGIEYSVPLATGSLMFDANVYHTSKYYSAPENRTFQDAYTLLNGSVGWAFGADQRFTIRAWGSNLANRRYTTQIVNQIPIGDFIAPGPGRTYGVTVGFKY